MTPATSLAAAAAARDGMPDVRRVLQVNKFAYARGGAEHYMYRLAGLLEEHGIESLYFAMHHPQNVPSPTSRYYVSHVAFDDPPTSLLGRAGVAGRTVYSLEARRNMDRLLADEQVDLAHLHNIYQQLSPSLLAPLAKRRIPVVMTVHDYKLACPTYTLLSHGDLCDQKCVDKTPFACMTRRCNRNSLSGSALLAGETWIHRRLGLYRDGVDVFVAPSRFARDRLVKVGYPSQRIMVVPNFVDPARFAPRYEPGEAFVYFGRLSTEKGADVLVRAAALTGLPVRLVGDGPQGEDLRALARETGAPVEFLGFRSGDELAGAVRGARAVVSPSRCHDNCPLAVIEAMGWGKPVIGSNVGGIPELVRDGEDGLLVPHNDAEALGAAMARLAGDDALAERMGRSARARVEEHYTAGPHMDALREAYALAHDIRRGGRTA